MYNCYTYYSLALLVDLDAFGLKPQCGSPTAMEQLQALLKSEASLTLILKTFFL